MSKNKKFKIVKFILISLTVFAVAAYGLIYFYLDKLSVSGGADGYPSPNKRVNVLVIGVANGLSDSLMLCSFDMKSDGLSVYSIPRDTYYPRKGYNHTAQKKINAAYGSGGADEVVKSVSGLTGIPIHFYVQIDYNAVKSIVDAIGGLEVVAEHDMNYDDPVDKLHIHFKKGQTISKGEDIIKVLRWRKNNHGGGYPEGDLGRIKMQQHVVKLGIEKVIKGNVVLNLIKLQGPITENVKTNMTPKQMMFYAKKANDIKSENISFKTIPGNTKTINRLSFYVVDKDKLNTEFEELKND